MDEAVAGALLDAALDVGQTVALTRLERESQPALLGVEGQLREGAPARLSHVDGAVLVLTLGDCSRLRPAVQRDCLLLAHAGPLSARTIGNPTA